MFINSKYKRTQNKACVSTVRQINSHTIVACISQLDSVLSATQEASFDRLVVNGKRWFTVHCHQRYCRFGLTIGSWSDFRIFILISNFSFYNSLQNILVWKPQTWVSVYPSVYCGWFSASIWLSAPCPHLSLIFHFGQTVHGVAQTTDLKFLPWTVHYPER